MSLVLFVKAWNPHWESWKKLKMITKVSRIPFKQLLLNVLHQQIRSTWFQPSYSFQERSNFASVKSLNFAFLGSGPRQHTADRGQRFTLKMVCLWCWPHAVAIPQAYLKCLIFSGISVSLGTPPPLHKAMPMTCYRNHFTSQMLRGQHLRIVQDQLDLMLVGSSVPVWACLHWPHAQVPPKLYQNTNIASL